MTLALPVISSVFALLLQLALSLILPGLSLELVNVADAAAEAVVVPPADDDDQLAELDLLEHADGLAVGHALHGHAVDREDLVTWKERNVVRDC